MGISVGVWQVCRVSARGARALGRGDRCSLHTTCDMIDKTLVDLPHIDGELLQIPQRRILRAEVIDRETHTECLERVQNAKRRARIISTLSVILSVSRSAASRDSGEIHVGRRGHADRPCA